MSKLDELFEPGRVFILEDDDYVEPTDEELFGDERLTESVPREEIKKICEDIRNHRDDKTGFIPNENFWKLK